MNVNSINLNTLSRTKKDPISGRFLPGHKGPKNGGKRKLGTVDLTIRLRNLLLDTLLEKDGSGKEIIVNAIVQCIGNKPEQLLALATRLLPKDINVNGDKTAFAPLVVVQNNTTNNTLITGVPKEIPSGHIEKKDERTLDAIAFSKPILVEDPIETVGSFTKEDFINANRTEREDV